MPVVETPQAACRMGLARGDITPPVGMYHRMWGAATHDRSTGVHRPLLATAVVFRDPHGSAEMVLIALDLCTLLGREMKEMLAALGQATGLRPDQLVVTFSHTHGSGLIGHDRAEFPGGDQIPDYLARLNRTVCDLVRQARDTTVSVTLTFATGHCGLAAHRDFWDTEARQFVCGFNPTGLGDDAVLVARATDTTGATVATMVNYACHPTTLAWENTLISPDFVGAMRERVERDVGGVCVFLQGASGDIGPREGFVGDPAVADRNGRQLGYAVLAALEGMPPPGTRFEYAGPVVSGATIGTWVHRPAPPDERFLVSSRTVPLAYRPDLPTLAEAERELARWQEAEHAAGNAIAARDAHAMAERWRRWPPRLAHLPPGSTFPQPVWLWRTGAAVWVATEGELYNIFQRRLRTRFPQTPVIVTTLANGSRSIYLPTVDAYGRGIYQESVAVLAAGCLETLTDAVAAEIVRLLA